MVSTMACFQEDRRHAVYGERRKVDACKRDLKDSGSMKYGKEVKQEGNIFSAMAKTNMGKSDMTNGDKEKAAVLYTV